KQYISAKRHCVIVGTSNDKGILTDSTGNRRYWIVPVGAVVNLDALREQREQLWAEAVHRYRAGEQWWLEPHLEEALRESQKQFERRDPWEELIVPWVERQLVPPTTADILERVIDKPAGQWNRADENRVGAILRRHGFEAKKM